MDKIWATCKQICNPHLFTLKTVDLVAQNFRMKRVLLNIIKGILTHFLQKFREVLF